MPKSGTGADADGNRRGGRRARARPPICGAMARPTPKRITRPYLEHAALAYLERFSSSAENLRRVLMRKVERSCRHHGEDAADHAGLVAEVVQRCLGAGLLDDRRYAEGRVAS